MLRLPTISGHFMQRKGILAHSSYDIVFRSCSIGEREKVSQIRRWGTILSCPLIKSACRQPYHNIRIFGELCQYQYEPLLPIYFVTPTIQRDERTLITCEGKPGKGEAGEGWMMGWK